MYSHEKQPFKIQITKDEYIKLSALAASLNGSMMVDPVLRGLNWATGVAEILSLSENQTIAMLNGQTEIIVARDFFDKDRHRFLPVEDNRAPLFMYLSGHQNEVEGYMQGRGYSVAEIEEMIRYVRQNAGF